MAKIKGQVITITLGKLVKDSNNDGSPVVGDDVIAVVTQLIEETIAQLDSSVIVEVVSENANPL